MMYSTPHTDLALTNTGSLLLYIKIISETFIKCEDNSVESTNVTCLLFCEISEIVFDVTIECLMMDVATLKQNTKLQIC